MPTIDGGRLAVEIFFPLPPPSHQITVNHPFYSGNFSPFDYVIFTGINRATTTRTGWLSGTTAVQPRRLGGVAAVRQRPVSEINLEKLATYAHQNAVFFPVPAQYCPKAGLKGA